MWQMKVSNWAPSLFLLMGLMGTQSVMAEPGSARKTELMYLLRQDCGSCHGMTLRGGLGPSLLPDALGSKPPELLALTILDGRAGTAMPPWRGELGVDDVNWLVRRLQEGISDDQ